MLIVCLFVDFLVTTAMIFGLLPRKFENFRVDYLEMILEISRCASE